jgi:uncharacterized protein (DUF697 family)
MHTQAVLATTSAAGMVATNIVRESGEWLPAGVPGFGTAAMAICGTGCAYMVGWILINIISPAAGAVPRTQTQRRLDSAR